MFTSIKKKKKKDKSALVGKCSGLWKPQLARKSIFPSQGMGERSGHKERWKLFFPLGKVCPTSKGNGEPSDSLEDTLRSHQCFDHRYWCLPSCQLFAGVKQAGR